MSKKKVMVAICATHTEAERAVKELQGADFDMKKLSIVGRDCHTEERVIGYYYTGDRMKYWGKPGAFWGRIWGLLLGAAFFSIPGVGRVLVAGPLVTWIVGALERAIAVGGMSALGAGLYCIGIPEDSVFKYETAIKADKFLVLAHGTADEVIRAMDITGTNDASEVAAHELKTREEAVAKSGMLRERKLVGHA